jgi:2-hydroxycyclohexanecarboxyl-CoA dehydrogenase
MSPSRSPDDATFQVRASNHDSEISMSSLAGKTAIVTGAGSGIGRAIAHRLAAETALGGVFDINAAAAEETVAEILSNGGRAVAVACDISDADAVDVAVNGFVAKSTGAIDILVNNAGWNKHSPFIETDAALRSKITAVNWLGTMNMTVVVARKMSGQGHGRIINIGSDAGRSGAAGVAVYSGCKGAVIAFSKSIARELAKDNVLINTVCLGPTDTPAMERLVNSGDDGKRFLAGLSKAVPMGRIGKSDDAAGMVVFLAGEDARFITGQVISVSGGLTMHG